MGRARLLFVAAALAAGACSERPLVALDAGNDGGEVATTDAGAESDASLAPDTGAGGDAGDAPLAWVEVPLPPGLTDEVTDEVIFAAWSAGPDELFFVGSGYYGGTDGTKPWGSRVLRWTAAAGFREDLMMAHVRSPALAITGTGPSDVWTAGDGHIYHRDAAGWQMVPDADWQPEVAAAATPWIFVDVVARADADDVWFVAPKFLLRRKPGRWSAEAVIQDPPAPHQPTDTVQWFDRLWTERNANLWVSGKSGGMGSTMDPALIAGFADGALTRAGVGLWPSPVKAAWPTFGGGFWFAEPGFHRDGGGQTVYVPLRHHDGDTTVDGIIQTGAEVDPLGVSSLWGRADDDVWAAGGYENSGAPALFHYDGHRWAEVHDAPRAGRYRLVTGDAQATWLVTEGPRFFRQIRR